MKPISFLPVERYRTRPRSFATLLYGQYMGAAIGTTAGLCLPPLHTAHTLLATIAHFLLQAAPTVLGMAAGLTGAVTICAQRSRQVCDREKKIAAFLDLTALPGWKVACGRKYVAAMRPISDLEYEQFTYDRETGDRYHATQYTRLLTPEEKIRYAGQGVRRPRVPLCWVKTDYQNLPAPRQRLLDTIGQIADQRPARRLDRLWNLGLDAIPARQAAHVPDAKLAKMFGLGQISKPGAMPDPRN